MPNYTRNDGITGEPVQLYYTFTINGIATNVYDFQQVKIYNTLTDAENDINAIETITTINNIDTGRYHYVMSGVSLIGTYYDRVFLIPQENDGIWSHPDTINPIFIRQEQYGGQAPGTHETARIYLNVFDVVDNPQEGDCVRIKLNVEYALYGYDMIEREEEQFTINSEGQVIGQDGNIGMLLIETDTLTEDTFTETGDDREVYYEANIVGRHFIKFKIPKGTLQANLLDDVKIPKVIDE